MLNIIELYNFTSLDFNSPDWLHVHHLMLDLVLLRFNFLDLFLCLLLLSSVRLDLFLFLTVLLDKLSQIHFLSLQVLFQVIQVIP